MIAYGNIIAKSKMFTQFSKNCGQNKISQSYLVVAPDKETLSSTLTMMAQAVYCETRSACGECKACRRIESGNHGNVFVLDKKPVIKVEDVMSIIDDTYLTSLEEGRKVYVINSGELISEIAQNKLLMTLEEPNENITILIGVTNENAILQTIKSRCNILYVNVWNKQNISEELFKLTDDVKNVELAIRFATGSITRAKNILVNESFRSKYKVLINMLEDFNNSTQLPEYINCMGKNKEEFLENLGILEQIIGYLLTNRNDGDVGRLIQKFNIRALSNIHDLVIESFKRINSNCNITAVTCFLLLGILEMRMKLS